MKLLPIAYEGDLVVAETSTSTWHYHIRRVGREGMKPGGGAGPALCGAKLGWDTRIPLSAYGMQAAIPAHWCEKCAKLAKLRM